MESWLYHLEFVLDACWPKWQQLTVHDDGMTTEDWLQLRCHFGLIRKHLWPKVSCSPLKHLKAVSCWQPLEDDGCSFSSGEPPEWWGRLSHVPQVDVFVLGKTSSWWSIQTAAWLIQSICCVVIDSLSLCWLQILAEEQSSWYRSAVSVSNRWSPLFLANKCWNRHFCDRSLKKSEDESNPSSCVAEAATSGAACPARCPEKSRESSALSFRIHGPTVYQSKCVSKCFFHTVNLHLILCWLSWL